MKPSQLYRHYNSTGTLLYVGISLSAVHRLSGHRDNSPWFKEIETVTIEHFTCRRLALKAEAEAIAQEHPIYNENKLGERMIAAKAIKRVPIEALSKCFYGCTRAWVARDFKLPTHWLHAAYRAAQHTGFKPLPWKQICMLPEKRTRGRVNYYQ